MSCDDYCCNHGCNQGRNCPARKTPAKSTERADQFQADTDRQVANGHADDTGDIGEIVLDGIAAALIVWLVAFVFAPALAGYLSHMKG